MLFSVMVRTSLSHTFHWSVRPETFFLVDIFSKEVNAKSWYLKKEKNYNNNNNKKCRRGSRSA